MARLLAMVGVSALALLSAAPAAAQVSIGISVRIAPPPLPVYEQPPLPGPDYVWTPGYWAWDDLAGNYYWVPGVWMLAPRPGLLWTPPWWGWQDGAYIFHSGYWGPHVGFYGGVPYGFGYTGMGFQGGYWRGNHFTYNSTVTNITNVHVTNVYRQNVVVNHITRASYNGGPGGLAVRPTPQEAMAAREMHVMPNGRPMPPMRPMIAAHQPPGGFGGARPQYPVARPAMATGFAAQAMAAGAPMPVVHRGHGGPGAMPPQPAQFRAAGFARNDMAWHAPQAPHGAPPASMGGHPMPPMRNWSAAPHAPPRVAFHPAPRPQPAPRAPHPEHHERH